MVEQTDKEATERLAARLRQQRRESGLTLREVAARTEWFTSLGYLSRALSGKQTLSLHALEAVTRVLGLDYRQVLAEAGLDEETYRSRHTKRARASEVSWPSHAPIRDLLSGELQVVRQLKSQGKPEEARGAIGAIERLVSHELGRLPADRNPMLTWASLLCERVGVIQDVQLAETVLPTAQRDLSTIATIADEYCAEDLRAVGHFYAGDVHFKAQDYEHAMSHYEQSATYAPTTSLYVRSLAGWAIVLAHLQRPGDEKDFQRLQGQITELLSVEEPEPPADYTWDAESWTLARLWSSATLARSLMVFGKPHEAEQVLEALGSWYERVMREGFAHAPFAMSLAQLQFLAACEGVLDMSEQDILQLGLQAHRLAEEGYCVRTKREIENIMSKRFGFQEW